MHFPKLLPPNDRRFAAPPQLRSSWRVAAPLAACCAALLGCQRAEELGPTATASASASIREALLAGGDGSAGGAAAAPTGTGWATLKGRFTFEGTPPTMPRYDVKSDLATCAPGGQAPKQEFLLVDPSTQGIKNVVIYPRKASRVHESASPVDESILFDQKNCVFLTHVLAFTTNQPITITNSDAGVGHNTKVSSSKNPFNQTIASGAKVEYTARKQEATPVNVTCSIHPWMISYFMPRDDQYFAVTAEDGSFEIANLPAGEEIEFQVWHENAAAPNGALYVDTPEGNALDWKNKGRFKIKLEENETRELVIPVPASAFAAG